MSNKIAVKAIVVLENSWVQKAGVDQFIERNPLQPELLKGRAWAADCRAVWASNFEMGDGWFMEVEFPLGKHLTKLLIPKQHVVVVIVGTGTSDMMGFK